MRRCIECDRRLLSREQGALCSDCYYAIICDPGLADPPHGADTVSARGGHTVRPHSLRGQSNPG